MDAFVWRACGMHGKNIGKIFSVAAIAFAVCACNFFGKQEDPDPLPTGQLASGTSIIGSWTSISSDTNINGEPSYAISETYTFDAIGGVHVDLREVRQGGITCNGVGQYRIVNSDVTIYMQAASPAGCGFPSQIYMHNVKIGAQTLGYEDPQTQYKYSLFKVRSVPPTVPVGVWDFDSAGSDANGEGGIDYIFFAPTGYFVMQTTSSGQQFLLIGYYTITNSQITLLFFANMDPAQTSGYGLVYKQFVTDGTVLDLIEAAPGGDVDYTGIRL